MRVRSIRHRGLRRLIEQNDPREIRPDQQRRVRRIIAAVLTASSIDQVQGPPGWRIHQLTGDRAATWSISVSGNWRITFELHADEVFNLDLEDYH